MLVKFNFSQNSRTRTTPIAGHLTVVSACSGGHLTYCFFKSQIPRGLPGGGGGGLIAVGFDSSIKNMAKTTCLRLRTLKSMCSYHAMTIYGMQSDKYLVIIKSILRTVRGSITACILLTSLKIHVLISLFCAVFN